ncbi:circadian clock KaiB family protein [soil metagenome]
MRMSPAAEKQVYRLYVRAASPVSSRAVVNARRFLDTFLPGAHRLTVLDIAANVASAQGDQIVACPTLIRLLPLPQRRFIGDMSDTTRLQAALGLLAPTDG